MVDRNIVSTFASSRHKPNLEQEVKRGGFGKIFMDQRVPSSCRHCVTCGIFRC
jgi:predicted metal-binding protein